MSVINSEAHAVKALTGFNQELSTEDTNGILQIATRVLLDRLSESGWVAAGQHIVDCVADGRFSDLCDYDPDVLDLSSADQRSIRQCCAFFTKRADIDLGVDRSATALSKFRESEKLCSVTNSSFVAWGQGRFQFLPGVESVLHAAQRKIAQVLGDCPSVADLRPRFGPGATTRVAKSNACSALKLKDMPTCSANLDKFSLSECLSTLYPQGYGPEATASTSSSVTTGTEGDLPSQTWTATIKIDSARLGFVPKTAKTDRAIVVEPSLNGMYQLAIGDVIATALRRVAKIDIRDQSANQRAALYGSISGVSATLDLSSASDTISTKLVEHLLPPEWFDLLSSFRSAEVEFGDSGSKEILKLEKFSSMGNGFTFPLETLIFWALAKSCVEATKPRSRVRTLVYGDDIICDVESVPLVLKTLQSLGFVPNEKKSFWTGGFRESCGHDYVFGDSVRPVYVTDRLTGSDMFRLHNFFFNLGDFVLADLWKSWLHPSVRLFGPKGFGDGHLHSSTYPSKEAKFDYCSGGHSFETWASRPKKLKKELRDRLGSALKLRGKPFEFKAKYHVLVRRIATYTQYLRETRVLTLTKGDELSHLARHVYADRRMPDPSNDLSADGFITTPGKESASRTRIYIFGAGPTARYQFLV